MTALADNPLSIRFRKRGTRQRKGTPSRVLPSATLSYWAPPCHSEHHPVILSEAKNLACQVAGFFAALRMTTARLAQLRSRTRPASSRDE